MFRGFLLGLVVAIIAAGVMTYLVVRDGVVPVNADGQPLPLEPWAAATALDAALAREAPKGPNPVSLADANSTQKDSLGKVSSDLSAIQIILFNQGNRSASKLDYFRRN